MKDNQKESKYIEAVGRRKTSSARVRLTPSSKTTYKINDRDLATYLPTQELRKVVEEILNSDGAKQYSVSVHVRGGGVHSQAEAIRHGIARALVKQDLSNRPKIKATGFLKRDPRAKERRKFGLKKARKAPQWSKR